MYKVMIVSPNKVFADSISTVFLLILIKTKRQGEIKLPSKNEVILILGHSPLS